jgi:hypothetical protein
LRAESGQLILRHDGRKIILQRRGEDRFYVNHPDLALFLLEFQRTGTNVTEALHGPDWYPISTYRGPHTFDGPPEWIVYPGHYRSYNPWLSNFRVVLRKGRLLIVDPDGNAQILVSLDSRLFQPSEQQTASRLRFDTVINGKAQRANFLGANFYRDVKPMKGTHMGTCHTPPLYTNNKLTPADGFTPPRDRLKKYDVMSVRIGTDPFLTLKTRRGPGYYKVPSLKGLWYRGMFQHDGSCATLEDWFDAARLRDDYIPTGFKGYGIDNRAVKGHAFGLNLSVNDKAALIAFLRTL